MFGLAVPVSQSERQDEFDSVSTILSHSLLARASNHRQTSHLTKLELNNEGLFHLKLAAEEEAKLRQVNRRSGWSVSSVVSGVGCSSEDTGYSSDQEIIAPENHFVCRSKLGDRTKWQPKKLDTVNNNCSKRVHKLSKDFTRAFLPASSPVLHEGDKRQSNLPGFGNIVVNHTCSHKGEKSSHTFSGLKEEEDNDDDVFVGKSDFRSSTTSSISAIYGRSASSSISSATNLSNTATFPNIASGHTRRCFKTSLLHTGDASRRKLIYKSVYIDIQLDSSVRFGSDSVPDDVFAASLCEELLGIIPVYKSEMEGMGRGKKGEVVVQGIVATSQASSKNAISAGTILHSVDDHDITWENMSAILCGIRKLKKQKIKLTLKSSRPDASPLDLETLVTILTSNVSDCQIVNSAAAMYISMDTITSDSQNVKRDALIYSYPSQCNSLHQLQGLFCTLSKLVKDIERSKTIHNTTLTCEGKSIHVSYLEEGSDLLVFALPATCFPQQIRNMYLGSLLANEKTNLTFKKCKKFIGSFCVSASELNIIILEFSRLLRVLFSSVEQAFSRLHWAFMDNILSYLFRQVLSESDISTLPSSLLSAADITETRDTGLRCKSFLRYSQHVQVMSLPDEILVAVGKILSEFESATFPEMPGKIYEYRRQYIILGSAFYHRGQLVSSHLIPADLHDLHLYLQHMGITDLMVESNVAQFIAWKEIYPNRFCHDIAEINSSFGYSEPNARWCWLIIGLKHGLLCGLLETVVLTLLSQDPLPLDAFYVDLGKSCLLQLQTPKLLAVFDIRVNKHSQSALLKSDYCTSYVNTTGEKMTQIFKEHNNRGAIHRQPHTMSWQSTQKLSATFNGLADSVDADTLCGDPYVRQKFTIGNTGPGSHFPKSVPTELHMGTSNSNKLSRNPSIYQYFYLDGLQGTVITGSDMESSGFFHVQIMNRFYLCCRQIHNFFVSNRDTKQSQSFSKKEDDDQMEQTKCDPQLKGIKEHGILLSFNPHQSEEGGRKRQSLEYWVVGRHIKYPCVREIYVCFHASASQNLVELAFTLSFSSVS